MTEVTLCVNGQEVTAEVEPRLQLADFLRENLLLTGTHIGCEHGVCGACTVLIDGEVARSCITFAVAVDGHSVTTIEGFSGDPLMDDLRGAFSREHALQCGYCTPGMLIAGYDIARRLAGADEARIRKELAGNLCRCTGYVGIVRAVGETARKVASEELVPLDEPPNFAEGRLTLPLVATRHDSEATAAKGDVPDAAAAMETPAVEVPASFNPVGDVIHIDQTLTINHPRDRVWQAFADPALVINCLPGATLLEPSDGTTVKAEMRVRLGPIRSRFAGVGRINRDQSDWSGEVIGRGVESDSSTRAEGRLRYHLDAMDNDSTQVVLAVEFAVAGPLAQFSRGGIVRDLAKRLTASFGENVAAQLESGGARSASTAAELDAGSLVFKSILAWFKSLFRRGR